MSRDLHINLAGARAVLHTTYEPLAKYAAVHLAPLLAPADEVPAVEALLRWHEGMPPAERSHSALAGMLRIDRDLYRSPGCLAWFRIDDLRDLRLRFEWDGKLLRVEGDYYHRLSNTPGRDRLKRVLYRRRLAVLRQRRFTTLLYYLVYYPCFWWLERTQGWHPIHAAGVESAAGVILLAGPSGVGKSTLAVALSASPGMRLLSDTFVLVRDTAARPVREPLLLDGWSRKWLGEATSLLQPIDWRYCLNRNGFHWPVDRASDGGEVSALVFPQKGDCFELRRVAAVTAHARISAANFIINDLRRYWANAAVLDMLDPIPLMRQREEALGRLTAAAPAWELTLDAAARRDDVVARLRTLSDKSAAQGSVLMERLTAVR